MINKGYKYSTAFCVSPTATKAFEKRGFVSWGEIVYKKFDHNGNKPFALLPDCLSIMAKELK